MTLLHSTAFKSSSDVAELLIRSGADVNAKDDVSHALIQIYAIPLNHHFDYNLALSIKTIA